MNPGPRAPSHLRLYTLIVLMVLFWAGNFIVGKIALREFPGALAVGLRTQLAGLFILPFYLLRNRGARWKASDLPLLISMSVLGVVLNQVFFVLGLERTSVAHASIMIGLTPILVLLLAVATGQERITVAKALGMAIALAGVALLQFSPTKVAGATLGGDFLVFLASLTFAMYTILGKMNTSNLDGLTVTAFAYVGGGLVLIPLTVIKGAHFAFSQVSVQGWMSIAYMAAFPSVIAYLIYYHALTYISASRVSAFSYLQPLIATLIAIPVLGETVVPSLLTGGALVLAGVFVTERL